MLLQEIYAREAINEAGITGSLEIIHAETPRTIVNGKDYGLLFPKRIFQSKPKDIEMLFVGIVTPKRRKFLDRFPDAMIVDSLRGRDEAIKGHDAEYWDLMSRAKYVLCPDGDFVWTYRFFEAVACGAIPIIETWHYLYNGYWYFQHGRNAALKYKDIHGQHNMIELSINHCVEPIKVFNAI